MREQVKRGKAEMGGKNRGGKRKTTKQAQAPTGSMLQSFDHFWKGGLREYNYSQLSIISAEEGSPF